MTREEKKINEIDKRVDNLETTFKMFMQEMRDFKTEMRNLDNQRAKEIIELRQKQEADMKEIRTSIDGISKHVQNLTVTAMVGVGTSVIAVVVLVGTTLYALLTH